MDKDIYSTLADSRPLIALIYKIYAKNTIYKEKKKQLYTVGPLSSPPVYGATPIEDTTITNRYFRGK